MPLGAYEKFGPYFSAKAYKESFWKALFRSSGDALPDNLIDISQIEDFRKDLEVNLIGQALDESDGVVAKAARLLNIRRTTLVEKMKKYGIQPRED